MILDQAQAKAILNVMNALPPSRSRAEHIDMPARGGENIAIVVRPDGTCDVWQQCKGIAHNAERHAGPASFASFYGLH